MTNLSLRSYIKKSNFCFASATGNIYYLNDDWRFNVFGCERVCVFEDTGIIFFVYWVNVGVDV